MMGTSDVTYANPMWWPWPCIRQDFPSAHLYPHHHHGSRSEMGVGKVLHDAGPEPPHGLCTHNAKNDSVVGNSAAVESIVPRLCAIASAPLWPASPASRKRIRRSVNAVCLRIRSDFFLQLTTSVIPSSTYIRMTILTTLPPFFFSSPLLCASEVLHGVLYPESGYRTPCSTSCTCT
jgi:hypothetical protein